MLQSKHHSEVACGILPLTPQSGQVLPLGLIVCGVGLLTWILSLDLGNLIHNKASLMRATDAAVYSAALVQARALNLHAYLNRAQLAHQIAMTHLITMAGAEQYRSKLAGQAARFNPPVPLIGLLFGAKHSAAYASAKLGGVTDQTALRQLSEAFSLHDETTHQVIELVRQQQLNQLIDFRNNALEQVLIKNIGDNGATMRGDSLRQLGIESELTLDELPGFVSRFSGSDSTWQTMLARASKNYTFLNERNHTFRNKWVVNIKCPHKRHELRRKGTTRMSPKGEWSVQDTQSFHALRYNRLIGCYQREYPMGWAMIENIATQRPQEALSEVAGGSPQNFSEQPFWRWVADNGGGGWNIFSGGDNKLSRLWAFQSKIRWVTQGLPSYTTVSPRRGQVLRLGLSVKQSNPLIQTHPLSSSLRSDKPYASAQFERIDALRASAAAETHFESAKTHFTPASDDANLWQPFWRARLIEFSQLPKQK